MAAGPENNSRGTPLHGEKSKLRSQGNTHWLDITVYFRETDKETYFTVAGGNVHHYHCRQNGIKTERTRVFKNQSDYIYHILKMYVHFDPATLLLKVNHPLTRKSAAFAAATEAKN